MHQNLFKTFESEPKDPGESARNSVKNLEEYTKSLEWEIKNKKEELSNNFLYIDETEELSKKIDNFKNLKVDVEKTIQKLKKKIEEYTLLKHLENIKINVESESSSEKSPKRKKSSPIKNLNSEKNFKKRKSTVA